MDKKVSELLLRPQYQQLSNDWFTARKSCISASSAASLLIRDRKTCEGYVKTYGLEEIFNYDNKCCNPYSSKQQYFLDKTRGATFTGSSATRHGQKYESVVTDIYSNLVKKTVLEFGLLIHQKYSIIAASPDGITEDGIMVEIKCPYRRKITGIPPLYYYFQVLLQLEVADLEFCDFVEYEFVEFLTEIEWLDSETLDKKFSDQGLLIQIESSDQDGIVKLGENKYIYPPKGLLNDTEKLLIWRDFQLTEITKGFGFSTENIKISTCYWKVGDSCITRIARDIKWFENVLQVFQKEWALIKYYKKGDNYKKLLKDTDTTTNTASMTIVMSDTEDTQICLLSDSECD
jgi:putative phage-type endonuclease